MEYNQEVNNLKINLDFLKLEAGQHEIQFLSNGEETTFEWENETIKKVNFKVRYRGKDWVLAITKGTTLNSLWGQICLIGRKHGILSGQVVNIAVKGEGKGKDYTILEALDLIRLETERRRQNE